MRENYYQPKPEEFHVGFRFEWRLGEDHNIKIFHRESKIEAGVLYQDDGIWYEKCTYGSDIDAGKRVKVYGPLYGPKSIFKDISKFEVKKLDKEDLEELGVDITSEKHNMLEFYHPKGWGKLNDMVFEIKGWYYEMSSEGNVNYNMVKNLIT